MTPRQLVFWNKYKTLILLPRFCHFGIEFGSKIMFCRVSLGTNCFHHFSSMIPKNVILRAPFGPVQPKMVPKINQVASKNINWEKQRRAISITASVLNRERQPPQQTRKGSGGAAFFQPTRNKHTSPLGPARHGNIDRLDKGIYSFESLGHVFSIARKSGNHRTTRVSAHVPRNRHCRCQKVSAHKAPRVPTCATNGYCPSNVECVLLSRNVGPYRIWVTSTTVQF